MEDENIEQEFGETVQQILDLIILIESNNGNKTNNIKRLKILGSELSNICDQMIGNGTNVKFAIETKSRINTEITMVVQEQR